MKQMRAILVFGLAILLLTGSFSRSVALANNGQAPVQIYNVQKDGFSGFRSDWNAGSGYFIINGSGLAGSQVRLISTGKQIYLEVPSEAFRGEFEIIIKHGNRFSVTTVTIFDTVKNWSLIGIGVGESNAVSQVMIGEYRFEQDTDGNPIIINPPLTEPPIDENDCDTDCEKCEDCPINPPPIDELLDEEDECDEENSIEELPPVTAPPVVEVSSDDYYEYFSILTTNILPQTSAPLTGTIYLGGGLLATAGLLVKLKKD